MKTFIISIITFIVIITLISSFLFFLNNNIQDFTLQINNIQEHLTKDDWTSSEKTYQSLAKSWESKRKWFEALSNHNKTDQITVLIAEMNILINSKDKNQVNLYCDKLKLLLYFLYDDELPTFENII